MKSRRRHSVGEADPWWWCGIELLCPFAFLVWCLVYEGSYMEEWELDRRRR